MNKTLKQIICDISSLKSYKKYIFAYRRSYSLMILMLLSGSLVTLVQPYFYKILIDDVLNSTRSEMRLSLLITYLSILLMIRLISSACSIYSQICRFMVFSKAQTDLESAVYRKLDVLPIAYHDVHAEGELLPLIYADPGNIIDAFTGLIPSLIESVSRAIMTFIIILSLMWWAGFIALAPLLPAGFIVLWNIRSFKKFSDFFFDLQQKLYVKTIGIFKGLRIVRLLGKTDHERNEVRELQNQVLDFNLKSNFRMVWINPLIETVAKSGGILLFIVGSVILVSDIFPNSPQITLGFLIMLMSYVWQLAYPVMQLGGMSNSFGAAISSAERLNTLFEEPEITFALPDESPIDLCLPAIQFRCVRFSYEPTHQVLQDVSFGMSHGEMIGLIGKSGSGKTTIAQLISGFYVPEKGDVLIYGQRFSPHKEFRREPVISVASQDPMLFQGSLRKNLLYGCPDASDAEIFEILNAVEATNFIRALPSGLGTELVDGSGGFSTGERQRISLARALLAQSKILILDEATSHIDIKTEERIYNQIEPILKKKTVIMISHRLHLMKRVDRIIMVDNGQLIEYSTLQDAMTGLSELHESKKKNLDLDA